MTRETGAKSRRLSETKGKAVLRAMAVSVLALGAASGAAFMPEPAVAQSYAFSSVRVEGNKRIDTGTILSYAGIGRGHRVSGADVNAAYQRIERSGLFESVEVVPSGRTLVIRVSEYPTINRVRIEGNKRLKNKVLQPILKSTSRRVFNPDIAEQDAQALAEAYANAGRIQARVSPKIIRRRDNRVDLVFEVYEGGTTEIERIGFVGNRAYSDRRLRRVLETKQAGLLRAFIRKDSFVADRVELDKQLLNDFYQSRGYVDFRTTDVNAELSQQRDGHFVTFNIQEGQQFRFGRISATTDIPGVNAGRFQSVLRTRSGTVYSPAQIEADIARLESEAIRQGLDFIRIEPVVTRNDRDLTLDISYKITKGPKIFVERIDIEGNSRTLDRVIRQQFRTVEGDPFNPRAIRESAERIRALGFFADAQVNAREGSGGDSVVVDVNVEEKPTGSLSFGATYSRNSGIGGVVKFKEENFMGRGQYFSLALSTGVDNREYSLSFSEPKVLGRDLAAGFSLSYRETNNQGDQVYDSEVGKFIPSLTFPLNPRTDLSLRYTASYSNIDGLGSKIGKIIAAEAALGALWTHSVGYTVTYDTKREGFDPTTRMRFSFGQDFGVGDQQFIKTTASAMVEKKVWHEEITLRATLEGGALHYTKGGSRVLDRFYMGSGVMRGFSGGGIGPREYDSANKVNDALGGNFYAAARFEADFPLGLPDEYGISGGVFYDVGSLWGLDKTNANVLYADQSWRHVAGLSIFWDTPIGPLRFNFSQPLKVEKRDDTQAFDVTISTKF